MHKDSTGRLIEKGSYVAFVATSGARAVIKFGMVVKLKQKQGSNSVFDKLSKTYNAVPCTNYSIQVITAEKNWTPGGQWSMQGKAKGKFARMSHLERLDRVIVLDGHQMHPEAKEAIDKEMVERGS